MIEFRKEICRRLVVKEQILRRRLRRNRRLAAAGALEHVVVGVEQVLKVALEPVEKVVGVDKRRRLQQTL